MTHGTRGRYTGGCRCDECRRANRDYIMAKRRAAGVKPLRRGGTCGTASGYRFGCRCDECRKAHCEYVAIRRARRVARLAADPSLAPHGNASTYRNWGCRCDDCRAAQAAYMRARRGA